MIKSAKYNLTYESFDSILNINTEFLPNYNVKLTIYAYFDDYLKSSPY